MVEAGTASYSYVPVDPYRVVDTRQLGQGRLEGGFIQIGPVLFDEFGIQQIPDEAVAVTYNLTVTDTVNRGYAAIYPADIDWPGVSTVNWPGTGFVIANAGTVAVGTYDDPTGDDLIGAVKVLVNPTGSAAHFIIDITGYYM